MSKKNSTNPERTERTNFTGNVPLNNAKTAQPEQNRLRRNTPRQQIQSAPIIDRNRLRREAFARGDNATYRRLINENLRSKFEADPEIQRRKREVAVARGNNSTYRRLVNINFRSQFEAHPNIQKRMKKVMEERRTPEEREARNRLRREALAREDHATYRRLVSENIEPIMRNKIEKPKREERRRLIEEERRRIKNNIISRNAHYRNMQRRLAEIREENRIEENQRRREENQRQREDYERRSLLVENGILEAPVTPPVTPPLATARVPNRNQMRQNALSRINMGVYHQLVNENVEAEMRRRGLLGGRRKIQKKKQVKGKGKGKGKGKK